MSTLRRQKNNEIAVTHFVVLGSASLFLETVALWTCASIRNNYYHYQQTQHTQHV